MTTNRTSQIYRSRLIFPLGAALTPPVPEGNRGGSAEKRSVGSIKKASAFTIIEMTVALGMLTTCFVVFAQVQSSMVTHQNRIDAMTTARLQLLNIFEMMGDVPAETLDSADFSKWKFDELVARTLPGGQVAFEILPLEFKERTPSDKSGKKTVETRLLRVTVSWDDGAGLPRRSRSLVRLCGGPR